MLLVVSSSVLGAGFALAQDASQPVTERTVTTTTLWVEPWVRVAATGVAVFLVVVIALTNRGSRAT